MLLFGFVLLLVTLLAVDLAFWALFKLVCRGEFLVVDEVDKLKGPVPTRLTVELLVMDWKRPTGGRGRFLKILRVIALSSLFISATLLSLLTPGPLFVGRGTDLF